MDKNQGYAILKAVMLENGRGFALGEHPTAPSRYVTWACYDDKDGQRQYEWGHYGNDRTAMEQDFADRVQDYQRIYNVGIRQKQSSHKTVFAKVPAMGQIWRDFGHAFSFASSSSRGIYPSPSYLIWMCCTRFPLDLSGAST